MDQQHHQQATPAAMQMAPPHCAGSGSGDVRQLRVGRHESQARFWRRFGVTQSSGSRFETGLEMPAPVAILVRLFADGKLSDADLPA